MNTKEFKKILGLNLRQFREAGNLTRAYVAHHAKIHYRTLEQIEKGDYTAGIVVLKKLCDFYELDLSIVVPSGIIEEESEGE
jgi:transcriptional regulator with XRE-family HTH domain